MGLRDGHPEKEGVLVNLSDLVMEVKQRLARKAAIDGIVQQAEGLRVVGGTRGEVQAQFEGEETPAPPLDADVAGEAPAS